MSVYIGIFLQPLPQVGGGLCFLCIVKLLKLKSQQDKTALGIWEFMMKMGT